MSLKNLIEQHGSQYILESFLADIDSLDPSLVAFGEINHFESRLSRHTLEECLPDLTCRGFNQCAIEMRQQFQPFLDDFMDGAPITNLSNLVCNPSTGAVSAYCQNRFCLTNHHLHVQFTQDFAALLESIRKNNLRATCIDAPLWKGAENRDNHMVEQLQTLLHSGDKVIWFGGARHMMIRKGATKRFAAELLSGFRTFRFVGMERVTIRRLPSWMNITIDRTILDHLLSALASETYVSIHKHKDVQLEVIYKDLDPEDTIRLGVWDAVAFFP